jgi:hypothetical protein
MLTRDIIPVLSLRPTSLLRRATIYALVPVAALASTVCTQCLCVTHWLFPRTSAHMRGRMCGALNPIVSGCHSSTHRYNIFIVGPVS